MEHNNYNIMHMIIICNNIYIYLFISLFIFTTPPTLEDDFIVHYHIKGQNKHNT